MTFTTFLSIFLNEHYGWDSNRYKVATNVAVACCILPLFALSEFHLFSML
jgi:hypothetical protein